MAIFKGLKMNKRYKRNLCKIRLCCILFIGSVSSGLYAGNPASQEWVKAYVPPVVQQMIQHGPTYNVGGPGPSGVGTVGYLTPNGQHGIEYITSSLTSVQSQVSYLAWQIAYAAPGGPGNASNWTAITMGQLNQMVLALGGCLGLIQPGDYIWTSDSPTNVNLDASMVPYLVGNRFSCREVFGTPEIIWIPGTNTVDFYPTIAVSTF